MFKKLLEEILKNSLTNEQIFQKYFIDCQTFFFRENQDIEYQMKQELAHLLKIHINDIYIIGSSKTGFSIKPASIGQKFDEKYQNTLLVRDKSDIDIAIVSNYLFENIMENMYDWSERYSKSWDKNLYYTSGTEKFGVSLKYKFLEYLGKGWYRPDFVPTAYSIENENGSLRDYNEKWRQHFKRKIGIAIYKNWNFFKKYQLETIEQLRIKTISGDLL